MFVFLLLIVLLPDKPFCCQRNLEHLAFVSGFPQNCGGFVVEGARCSHPRWSQGMLMFGMPWGTPLCDALG